MAEMSWKFALVKMLKDKNKLLYSDDEIAIIADCYPKAELHYLVLPKENISSIKDITSKHLKLLKYMEMKGKEYSQENGQGKVFRYGYHSEPSMTRLHLHVVSDDFNSPCLKNKKHWNSYNTSFFIESSKAISDVESLGKVNIPSPTKCSVYLKTPLKCHKCDFVPKNLPKLKEHILEHL